MWSGESLGSNNEITHLICRSCRCFAALVPTSASSLASAVAFLQSIENLAHGGQFISLRLLSGQISECGPAPLRLSRRKKCLHLGEWQAIDYVVASQPAFAGDEDAKVQIV